MILAMSAGASAVSSIADTGMQQPHLTSGSAVRRSSSMYQVPDIGVVREDGRKVNIRAELEGGGPVLVGFVFTTCTAICPLTSATFRQIQDRLRPHEPLLIASISIDPERDTPARLRTYAHQFGAGPNWHHYTGSQAASQALQKAFDAYRGDKMEHTAVAFLRMAPGRPWVRIDGFASADEWLAQYRSEAEPGALASR